MKEWDELQYKKINQEIKRKCNEAKEIWFDNKCKEMEKMNTIRPNEIYEKIRKISGKKKGARNGGIRSEDGKMLIENPEICKRWERYIKELFDDVREEAPNIDWEMEGPEITKDEIKSAIKKMNKGKSIGPDDIAIEMVEAMGDEGLEIYHKIFNYIYDSGKLPDDFLRSVFITLPKKPGAVDCKDFRTISIMSHSVKILLRIIIERIRSKLRPEISDEQFGFMPDKGTRNAIFILRMLCERAMQHQQNIFLCFIDYTKAFDKVQHEELVSLLKEIHVDNKDIQLIKNLYWNQKAAVRVDDVLTDWIKIIRGLRQGCVQSPDFFNLYSEFILRAITDIHGVKLGGVNINNIRYADDTTLIASSEEELQKLLDIVKEESGKKGLSINCSKTKSMVISKTTLKPQCRLKIEDERIEEVEHFKYLGSIITSDVRCKKEVKIRIAIAKHKFQEMHSIFVNRNLSMKIKTRLLKCYIWSVLTYGCETWTLTPELEGNIEAAEMWFLRRMLKISYVDRITNKEVMVRAGVKRELLSTITKRQLNFLGHVLRKEGLECLVLQGRMEGKRGRGRPRTTFMDRIKKVTGINSTKTIFDYARDRTCWREVTAKACITQGS